MTFFDKLRSLFSDNSPRPKRRRPIGKQAKKAAAPPPENLDTRRQRARVRLRGGDLIGAIEDLDTVIAAKPLLGDAYLDRGSARSLLDQQEEALEDLRLAIALLPSGQLRLAARNNCALVKEALGDISGALAELVRARDGGFPPAAQELERIRALGGLEPTAGEPLAPEPAQARELCERARACAAEQPLTALSLFCQAHDADPASAEACHGMALSWYTMENPDAAITHFSCAIELARDKRGLLAEALFNRGSLLRGRGLKEQAITDWERCLELCRDPEVGFPAFGEPTKNALLIDGLAAKLEALRAED